MADPDRDVLISLCEQVLSAEMTMDDLERAWPAPVTNPALAPVHEALEDGIEHTPVNAHGVVRARAWQTMPEYDDIAFYLRRLRETAD